MLTSSPKRQPLLKAIHKGNVPQALLFMAGTTTLSRAPQQSVSPKVKDILKLIQENHVKLALEAIQTFDEPKQALSLIQALLKHNEPCYWVELLKNPLFENVFTYNTLNSLLQKTQSLLIASRNALYPKEKRDLLNQIGPIIASNKTWRRCLGYTNLALFADINRSLCHFIITDREFLAHLDVNALQRLLENSPGETSAIVKRLLGILDDMSLQSHHAWINHAFKRFLFSLTHLQQFLTEDDADALIDFYHQAFEADLDFSYEVCLSPFHCILLNIAPEKILSHPKLTAGQFFALGALYATQPVPDREMACRCYLKSWEREKLPHAALGLAILYAKSDVNQAWEWFSLTLTKMSSREPQLLEALTSFRATLIETDHPLLAELDSKVPQLRQMIERDQEAQDELMNILSNTVRTLEIVERPIHSPIPRRGAVLNLFALDIADDDPEFPPQQAQAKDALNQTEKTFQIGPNI